MAKKQSVFRVDPRRCTHTSISNALLQDKRISHETKGLICELLSRPLDYEITVRGIMATGKSGRDKVYRMIQEAESFGYIKPAQGRGKDGEFQRVSYLVTDIVQPLPENTEADINVGSPLPPLPETAEPLTANPPQQRKESNKGMIQTNESASLRSAASGAQARAADAPEVRSTDAVPADEKAKPKRSKRQAELPMAEPEQTEAPMPAELPASLVNLPADLVQRFCGLMNAWPAGPGKRKVFRPDQAASHLGEMLRPYADEDQEILAKALIMALSQTADMTLDDDVTMKGPKGAVRYFRKTLQGVLDDLKTRPAIEEAKLNGARQREAIKTQGAAQRQAVYVDKAAKSGPRMSEIEIARAAFGE